MTTASERAPEFRSDAKRRLLEKFLRGEVARQNWELPIEPRGAGTTAPLAPGQHLIWVSSQMTASEPVYNAPITIHHRGPLERKVLERAFHEFVRRHEILRTTFVSVDGEVVQAVHDHTTIQIPYLDLSKLLRERGEQQAAEAAAADSHRLFDLAVGPLFRVRLVKLEPEYHRIYLTVHHAILDGVSIYNVLLPELAAIYEAFAAGKPSPLEEPRYQYSDFALWQKRMLDNDSVTRQIDYWREQLAGELPDLPLPTDRPRPAVHSYRGGKKTFTLPAELTAALRKAAGVEGVTLYMFLLAAFKTLLHCYSGQGDILIGGVSGARRRPEFQKLMGNFSNFFALRTHPSGEATFREYLAQVKDTVLGALANGDVPLDQVIREVQPRRKSARRPFFQATFSMEPLPAEPAPANWTVTQMDTATGYTKFDLYLEIDERADGLFARFDYSAELFDAATIDRMAAHWLTLLRAAIDDPGTRLCDLGLISQQEIAHEVAPEMVEPVESHGARMVAPRNEIERKLAAIWESVLGTRAIGIEDNFFDLGGHSFQVAILLRKIEAAFGARLSMAALFEAPTISRLAEMLGDRSMIAQVPRTAALQRSGALEPLFWIYGGPLFLPLTSRLGTQRPILGVDLSLDSEGLSGASFPEFATRLMRTIREKQPHGPYHLAGWCISGLLGYEVASQLIDAGEKVGLVIMLDAPNPDHYFKIPKRRLLSCRAAYHLKRLMRVKMSDVLPYLRERAQGLLKYLSGHREEWGSPVLNALHEAVYAYCPKPIPARVLAVQAQDCSTAWNLRESWAQHIEEGDFEVRAVPGTHVTMLEEPHVAAVAGCLRKALRDNVVEIRRAAAG
jgi:thioesterase domain-containing protein/acyl carrier protein